MSLRDRLGVIGSNKERHRRAYESWGVLENPFPPASQPMGHPHQITEADLEIEKRLKTFLEDKVTEALVVEGTQGLGKTNILEYYKNELSDLFGDESGYYIVRYSPDPEPDFSAVVRHIVQEFGLDHIKDIGRKFARKSKEEKTQILAQVRSFDTKRAFIVLAESADEPDELENISQYVFEYLLGLRLYKRHTDSLGVQFRLDTTESKIQALHDLVVFSQLVGCLEAIFLFLDELEKQGNMPPASVSRYLQSIRALIDALPYNLFLVLAMTPDARRRYALSLPALAGRLQAHVSLSPLDNEKEALSLYNFYLEEKRRVAKNDVTTSAWAQGDESPLSEERVRSEFRRLLIESERRGEEVTPRAFLNRLHSLTEDMIK